MTAKTPDLMSEIKQKPKRTRKPRTRPAEKIAADFEREAQRLMSIAAKLRGETK